MSGPLLRRGRQLGDGDLPISTDNSSSFSPVITVLIREKFWHRRNLHRSAFRIPFQISIRACRSDANSSSARRTNRISFADQRGRWKSREKVPGEFVKRFRQLPDDTIYSLASAIYSVVVNYISFASGRMSHRARVSRCSAKDEITRAPV